MIRFIGAYRDRFGVEAICRTLGATECGFLTARGFRAAQARRAPEAEVRRLAEDLDAALTAAMRAAYAAQRAEIGPLGYDDRIFRRKKMATPTVHALTAQAEHLLTLRETHRLTGVPAVAYDPAG